MITKSFVAGLAAAALSLPALAGDQTVSFASASSTGASSTFFASFNAPAGTALDGGSDTITFAGLAAGTYTVDLTLTSAFAKLTSVVLNGQTLALAPSTSLFGNYSATFTSVSTPVSLVLNGTADNGFAFYSGNLNVVPVPEPETYALMLAGLGAVLFIARRRNSRD